jgi:S1-C subfamily serine protease
METYNVNSRPSALGQLVALLLPTVLMLLIFGALLWFWWPKSGVGLDPSAQPRAVEARGDLSEEEKTNIKIYETASPSVAFVTNLTDQPAFFGLDVQRVPQGAGSGFVWDTDGHIVTNFHVVRGANAANVTLADHTTHPAKEIWYYESMDIAVVSIDPGQSKLVPVMIGSSQDLKVGQFAYAIGNPFGLDHSMTLGIVSALNREIESANGEKIRGAIQTSAAINPGNSGGPLLDSAGRLIGMNSAIVSPSGSFAGIGFAIPVDEINRIVPQLIRHGKVVRPTLGVSIAPDQDAHKRGVDKGVLIAEVVSNSAAAEAGLKGTTKNRMGDVILAIDGTKINKFSDLQVALSNHKVGDTVTITILRDGETRDIQATLGPPKGPA